MAGTHSIWVLKIGNSSLIMPENIPYGKFSKRRSFQNKRPKPAYIDFKAGGKIFLEEREGEYNVIEGEMVLDTRLLQEACRSKCTESTYKVQIDMPVGRIIGHIKCMSSSLRKLIEVLFVLFRPHKDDGRTKVRGGIGWY